MLVRAMQIGTERLYRAEEKLETGQCTAMDADSGYVPAGFKQKSKDLQFKFDALFANTGSVAAAQFLEKNIRFASSSFIKSIEPIVGSPGLSPFTLSGSVLNSGNEVFMKAAIQENVSLIKSVNSKYFERIEKAIADSLSGKSSKSVYQSIKDIGGMSERQAKFIARDQNSKIYSQLNVENMKKAGITKCEWAHSGAGKKPRTYHQRRWDGTSEPPNGLNGYVFEVTNPPISDLKTGERALPGMLINCRCVLLPVVDF